MDNSNILTISQNNVDVRTASGTQIAFSAQYPFAKLDRTNSNSFFNISLYFAHEPPNPNGSTVFEQSTLVYQFVHGYNYVPSTWFLLQNAVNTGIGLQPPYQQEGGIILATDEGLYTAAEIHLEADDKNVYFYIYKYYNSNTTFGYANIQYFTLLMRVYVFVGDLSGTTFGS